MVRILQHRDRGLGDSGRFARFKVHEFTEDGTYIQGECEQRAFPSSSFEAVTFYPLILGKTVGNDWARLTYPANRNLHAISTISRYHKGDYEPFTSATAVEPATGFRLVGIRRDDHETALSVVNPTADEQTVTICLYPKWPEPGTAIENV